MKIRHILAELAAVFIPCRSPRKKIQKLIRQGLFTQALRKYLSTSTKKEAQLSFPHFLSVCAIAKNEGRYFREWLEYHLLVGVEKFYIYDNDSSDDTYAVLKPYIECGLVEYIKFPGEKMQMPAYHDCLKRCQDQSKWLALIDLDEFIVPIKNDNIQDFLRELPADVSQVLPGWAVYGSSSHVGRPAGLVMENYLYRAEQNWQCKSIVKPRMAMPTKNAHYFIVMGKTTDEHHKTIAIPSEYKFTHDTLRINHYHCKSWEEYQNKLTRGDVFFGSDCKKYNKDLFDAHDKNEVFDPAIVKYIDKVKERLNDNIQFRIRAKVAEAPGKNAIFESAQADEPSTFAASEPQNK